MSHYHSCYYDFCYYNNTCFSFVLKCPELVAPYGSYEPIFGTNPIAIGIPTSNQNTSISTNNEYEKPIVLDMATSAAALFSLHIAKRDNLSIPNDVAYDCDGNETISPDAALNGALRVFDRSHKGSHLALMVELLAGALSGADMIDKKNGDHWGSLIIAIDPGIFGNVSDFYQRVKLMCHRVKRAKRLPGIEEILLPGEQGDRVEELNKKNGYIVMRAKDIEDLKRMAIRNQIDNKSSEFFSTHV